MVHSKFKMVVLIIIVSFVSVIIISCGNNDDEVITDESTDIEEEILDANMSYYDAFVDYYDYACYVIDGDEKHFHHQECDSIKEDNYTCRIYNKAEVLEQNLEPCSICWELTPDDFLSEYYAADTNEAAYKDAAIEVVAHCAVMNYSDTRYYHRLRCNTMDEEDFFFLNTEAAEAEGYEPCPTCWGGENANARLFIENTY